MDYKVDILLNSERDLETAISTTRRFWKGIESMRVDTYFDEHYPKYINIKGDLSEIKKIRAIEIESIGKHVLKVNNWSEAFREVLKYLIAVTGPGNGEYKTALVFSTEKIGLNEDFPLLYLRGWVKMPVGKENIVKKIIGLFEAYAVDLEKVTLYGE